MAEQQEMVGSVALRTILQNMKEVVEGIALYPVDVEELTPLSTFRKNAVIGINGVLYRAKKETSNFPVSLAIIDNEFVVDIIDGKRAFVVIDDTVNEDWEIWTDAALDYWLQSVENQIRDISRRLDMELQMSSTIKHNGQTYTVSQLLHAIAELIDKSVVVKE